MRIQNHPMAYGFLAGSIVLILGLFANAGCMHDSKLDTAKNIENSYSAAVEITAFCVEPDGTSSGWFGSGVIVDAQHVLTAAHVVETTPGETCTFMLEDAGGKDYLAFPKAVLASSKTDLAVLELMSFNEKLPAQPVRYGPVPYTGEIVCSATAHPRREYRCGQVMKIKTPPGDIRIAMTVEPGNSGSALYNMRHELVGVVVHTYPNRSNGQYVSGGASSLYGHLKELGLASR